MRRLAFGLALVAVIACKGSDPEEMARERGAIELTTSWPCSGGAKDLGTLAGGDLKTDWSAARQPDGAYRVTRRRGASEDTWLVHLAERTVAPETDGAKAAWSTCVGGTQRPSAR